MVVAAAIVRDGRLLVAQRSRPTLLRGLWELPGGKVEAGETEIDALARECREELGVSVVIQERVGFEVSIDGDWVLRVYAARILDGEPQVVEHLALNWLAADELPALAWLPGNALLIPDLDKLLRG